MPRSPRRLGPAAPLWASPSEEEAMADPRFLSEILVGDLVTPHDLAGSFEYVASVVRLDDEIKQVDLPAVLGEYPAKPSAAALSEDQIAALRAGALPTQSAVELLSMLDDETFIPAPTGLAYLRADIAQDAPDRLGELTLAQRAVAEEPHAAFEGSPFLVAVVVVLLLALLAVGALVAIRAVSGY